MESNQISPVLVQWSEKIAPEVARIAYDSHCKGEIILDFDAPTEVMDASETSVPDVYYISGGILKFASIAAKCHCVAVGSFGKISAADSLPDFDEVVEEASCLQRGDRRNQGSASSRLIGMVSVRINVLSAAANSIEKVDATQVLRILQLLGAALPYLHGVTVKDLLGLASVAYRRTLRDMAAGRFFSDITQYLSKQPTLAYGLYEMARSSPQGVGHHLYAAALRGMANAEGIHKAVTLAFQDVESESNELIAAALSIIGLLSALWSRHVDLNNQASEVIKKGAHHSDLEIRKRAWQAMAHAAESQSGWIPDLLLYSCSENQFVLRVLQDFIFFNSESILGHPYLTMILKALAELEPEYVDGMDHVMATLVKAQSHTEVVYEVLSGWMIKNYDGKMLVKT